MTQDKDQQSNLRANQFAQENADNIGTNAENVALKDEQVLAEKQSEQAKQKDETNKLDKQATENKPDSAPLEQTEKAEQEQNKTEQETDLFKGDTPACRLQTEIMADKPVLEEKKPAQLDEVSYQTGKTKNNKELPHQEDDLVPFEIVEPGQEPPKKLGLKDAISTLPENEKSGADINKAPKSAITTMPKSIPAQPANKSVKIDFASRFRNKLKQLLGMANQKRQAKAQANLDKIIKYAKEKQKVTNNDVERITGVKDAQATRYLEKLVKQGRIVKFGKTSNTFYKPVK